MTTKDYKMILDSLQTTGIYVIREESHEILYYNRHVKEVAPDIKLGMVCHEVWAGSCDNCPLLHIGDKKEARSINYDDPFGEIVEITANRIMWDDSEPAFLIMVAPYTETDAQKQERERNDQRLAAIIKSRYGILSTVDLESGMCERIYLEEASSVGKVRGDYSEYIKKALDYSVAEADKPKFKEVFLLENLRKKAEDVSEFKEEIFRYRCRLNPVMWLEEHLLYMKQGGKTVVNILGRDITSEKKAQEREEQALREACDAANQANEAKSEFMSRMSHDMRTPLNAIIGMNAIAEKYIDDRERVADCLNKINISSKHLLSLVNEVLDMSKIESGKIELSEEEINIPKLIDNAVTIIRPTVQNKQHSLDVNISNVEHENVIGDAVRLQQIFMNILSNSVKYTPDGGEIKIEAYEKPSTMRGYGYYEFIFTDNGNGMSKEFLEKLFEPFSREEDSRVSKIEGAGLGMTIARNIARRMNGDITAESELGKGTKLVVSLPLKISDMPEADAANAAGQTDETETRLDGKRLLLVEDNELNREIAVEIISQMGVAVESAENGQEAVCLFEKMPPNYYDMIFMDIQMPVMNGYDATVAIRNLEREDAADIPIVAMTANAFTEDINMSKKAGMNEHMTKPLDVGMIMKCMKRWMNG